MEAAPSAEDFADIAELADDDSDKDRFYSIGVKYAQSGMYVCERGRRHREWDGGNRM